MNSRPEPKFGEAQPGQHRQINFWLKVLLTVVAGVAGGGGGIATPFYWSYHLWQKQNPTSLNWVVMFTPFLLPVLALSGGIIGSIFGG